VGADQLPRGLARHQHHCEASDGREFEAEPVVGTSFTDIALLRIKTKKPEKFTAIKFAATMTCCWGDGAGAGNPFGLGGSVSRGILSSKTRRPPRENEPLDVRTGSRPTRHQPGNSGGPLVKPARRADRRERRGLSGGPGISFAIPVKRVSAALASSIRPSSRRMTASRCGSARGCGPGALPLIVSAVSAESPAAKAGLRAGDEILQVNGHAPRSFIGFSGELIKQAKENPPSAPCSSSGAAAGRR